MQSVLMILFFLCASFIWTQEQQVVVHFDVNETTLQAADQQKLVTVAQNDRANHIEIEGYADTTGNEANNQQLSKDRALAVYRFLVEQGMDTSVVQSIIGRGQVSKYGELAANRKTVVTYTETEIPSKAKDTVVKVVREVRETAPSKKEERVEKIDHKSKTRDGKLNKKTVEALEVGEILNVSDIQFIPGRHTIKRKSQRTVKKLIRIMEDYPSLVIEIQGHICCKYRNDGLDPATGKQNLSKMRALEVYKALLDAGIAKNRLTYKGYGPTRKLVKETDEASRQRNRRVSIEVLAK
mgnify:CR=1 FL=1